MVNILISETDILFQCGLQYFFKGFFSHVAQQDVAFTFDFTADSIRAADVIVLSLCQGEYFTCFPELQARQQGIIIGIVEDDARVKALPSCFQDIIFIPRSASLDHLRQVLSIAWHRTQSPCYIWRKISCFECQCKILSPQQIRIMMNFYRGLSVVQIARAMKISDKTVFTHKYIMMQKFNLRNDFELMALIRKMMEKKSHLNMLRDYLVNNYG
ncbi:helix-turn-helix transcriptional regulator [Enterobacter asburiae]|uniref:helix-turn-helix transcriptional regulator n=1 Tax=Enterobacter asburiae TaxID=61645 RepID=UPI0011D26282|nr:LuxR C-terminal-related transcriptional regulator [Enterobacter asburiae]